MTDGDRRAEKLLIEAARMSASGDDSTAHILALFAVDEATSDGWMATCQSVVDVYGSAARVERVERAGSAFVIATRRDDETPKSAIARWLDALGWRWEQRREFEAWRWFALPPKPDMRECGPAAYTSDLLVEAARAQVSVMAGEAVDAAMAAGGEHGNE